MPKARLKFERSNKRSFNKKSFNVEIIIRGTIRFRDSLVAA